MRLLPQQVAEALARLSPKTRAVAVDQASDPETKERLASLPDEIKLLPITDDQLKQVAQSLEEAPPVPFDVARQVRVYEPYLQYAEITLSGAAIHRYRVKIPRVLQDLGISEELEGRLQTTFELIQKDNSSNKSFKSLEKEVEEIRDCYTPSLGKGYGRVILKRRKPLLKEEIAEVERKIENLKKEETCKLQTGMNESRQLIIDHYLQRVTENPPRRLRAQSNSEKPTNKDAREWLGQVLKTEFPTAETLTQGMGIEVRYKDVTFEDLKCEDFLNLVKKAFQEMDWDRAHEEFMAAGESNSGD